MFYNESISVFGDWFFIRFIENPGMAFGLEFGGEMGKLLLTLLRIAAVAGIAWYIKNLIAKNTHKKVIICLSLILGGAIGNIIDSVFYGKIFSQSSAFTKAALFPAEGGYAGWLEGRVVDMLYFPLFEGTFPSWLPFFGGEHFLFFSPIFNLADSAITIGVVILLLFQKRWGFATNK